MTMDVAMILMLLAVQPAIAIIPCIVINSTLPLANDTIDTSCTSVAFVNVVAQGNMMINLSVAAMVQANQSAANMTVTIRNVSLLSGAALLIDSNGFSAAGPTISILVQNLTGTDGALVFIGSFPDGTSILVSDANMTASSSSAPTFAQFDVYHTTFAKVVMLVNFTLRNSASFLMQRSDFIALSSSNGGIPMYIIGQLTVANASNFDFLSCTWAASSSSTQYSSYAFCMQSSPANIANLSQWTFT